MKSIRNYKDFSETAKKFIEKNPHMIDGIAKFQLDLIDYYDTRMQNASANAKGMAVAKLEELKIYMDSAIKQYSTAALDMYTAAVDQRLANAHFDSDDFSIDPSLRASIANNYEAKQKDFKKYALRLLSFHTITDSFISGVEANEKQDEAMLKSYGLNEIISVDELRASREQWKQTVFHGDYDISAAPPHLTIENATLTLDSSLHNANGITLDNANEKLASGECDEWANEAFTRMMKGIYTDTEYRDLIRARKNPLEGIFLNGVPLAEAIKSSPLYDPSQKASAQYARCAAAMVMAGDCKVSVTRFEKNAKGEYEQSSKAATATIKPEVKEGFNLWRSIKRFFGLEKSEKERRSAISFASLSDDEAMDKIKTSVENQKNTAAINKYTEANENLIKKAFVNVNENFNYKKNSSYTDLDTGEKINALPTIERSGTRASLAALYMHSKGMSAEDILSNTLPNIRKKIALGKEFTELLHIDSESEFLNRFENSDLIQKRSELYEAMDSPDWEGYMKAHELLKKHGSLENIKNHPADYVPFWREFPHSCDDMITLRQEIDNRYTSYIDQRRNEMMELFSDVLAPQLKAIGDEIPAFSSNDTAALRDNYSKLRLLSSCSVDLYQVGIGLLNKTEHLSTYPQLKNALDHAFKYQSINTMTQYLENNVALDDPNAGKTLDDIADFSMSYLNQNSAVRSFCSLAQQNGSFGFDMNSPQINEVLNISNAYHNIRGTAFVAKSIIDDPSTINSLAHDVKLNKASVPRSLSDGFRECLECTRQNKEFTNTDKLIDNISTEFNSREQPQKRSPSLQNTAMSK